jgi:uncharacterized protein
MPSSLCIFSETCGDALVIEHNGDVYSCDHYVYPRNRLGNLLVMPLTAIVNSPQQRIFGEAKASTLTAYCLECRYLRACNGVCPKHRFAKTPSGEAGLNYLCPAYKKFFSHVDPYLAFMAGELAQERPPANVMKWARERDAAASHGNKVGPNDACPCGSARKYKRCCGRRGAST